MNYELRDKLLNVAELAGGSELERDIALGLLREIYSEIKSGTPEPEQKPEPADIPESAVAEPAYILDPERPVLDIEEPVVKTEPLPGPEPVIEEPEPEPLPEPVIEEPEPELSPEPVAEDSGPVIHRMVAPGVIRSLYGSDSQVIKPSPAPEPVIGEPKPVREPEVPVSRATLGDAMGEGRQTLGETLRNGRKDMASHLAAADTRTLKSAIGINDRFMMVRDMFGGDAAAFDRAIEDIDRFADLDEAIIHIHDTYDWSADSDGVKLLVELLERKLG